MPPQDASDSRERATEGQRGIGWLAARERVRVRREDEPLAAQIGEAAERSDAHAGPAVDREGDQDLA
jgi:hypothetical protein